MISDVEVTSFLMYGLLNLVLVGLTLNCRGLIISIWSYGSNGFSRSTLDAFRLLQTT